MRLPVFIAACLFVVMPAMAQPGAEVDLQKPEKYENRKLASEKTGQKKFTLPRRFMQNLTTHYNYYFNANNRLNAVIYRARAASKDDYNKLLPFYSYSLEATSQDKGELDSVIYKATAGILLHDLRSDWVDNMYLLMAKAYLLRNDLDSATMTLQYLNYAFAPKEEGGYDIPIGSNSSNESGEFSIATKEPGSIVKKAFGRPPSRNESFLWQVRAFIEHDELPEAAGLIEILKNDPQFPDRLQSMLNEQAAYLFYKQHNYDSSAYYLSNALDEALDGQDQARWEYLIGQMYQRANNANLAAEYYGRSIKHTNDPVMDVYARLNTLKLNRGDDRDYASENLAELLKMARRDKYIDYRDIIYFAAASIELDRKNLDAAEALLLKSVQNSNNNPRQRSESFLLLADMNYDAKRYTPSSNYYDSTDINSLSTDAEKDRVMQRKPPLKIVAENELTIKTQDSLQMLANMPADKRDAMIKAKIKELRKTKGLKDEDVATSVNPAIQQQQSPDLFGDNKSSDFYFYNASLKARGFNEFKARWGQRPNVDNWRRMSAVNRQSLTPQDVDAPITVNSDIPAGNDLSYEGLLGQVPLTEEKLATSNSSIEDALNTLGETFLNSLEDYPSAINAYEELLRRFPNSAYKDKAMFNLVYAYSKTGDLEKSNAYKAKLTAGSDTSHYAQLIKNPKKQVEDEAKQEITKKYENIYNMFIEGDFENALRQKEAADSVYGKTYWTPQLLYIEAIYYVSKREDSTAIKVLTDLATTFAGNPMEEKAKTMISVLGRRAEIEDYLTRLQITRNEDAPSKPPVQYQQPATVNSNQPVIANTAPPVIKKDSIAAPVTMQPQQPIKKDSVVTTVTKPVVKDTLPPNISTPVKNDTVAATVKPVVKDTLPANVQQPVKKDTVPQVNTPTPPQNQPVVKNPPPATVPAATPEVAVKGFSFKPADPHYVAILLDKVDPVYASEAKNAFTRFNREKYYNQQIDVTSIKLDDRFNLVLEGPFGDANAAVTYIDNVKPVAGSRILPWLSAAKYSFIVISAENLDVLKSNNDLDAYKQLLQQAFPGKF